MRTNALIALLFSGFLACSSPQKTLFNPKVDQQEVLENDTKLVKELRGVWITNVDSDVLFSAESIAKAMKDLADKGFNVVFPVVWNEDMTLFPSEVMVKTFGESYRQDTILRNAGIDPLAIMTFEAHRNGLEIIPWFEFGFSSSYNQNGGHVVALKPHWAAKDSSGSLLKKNNFEWLNGIHPEVQQFMTDLIMEVVQNYDIDGIQGDDRLPAMPSHGDFSDYTISLYKSETGKDVTMSKEPDFMAWKAGKLNDFAQRLYAKVKAFNSNLIVSFSPSVYPWSYDNYLQDSPTWVKDKYVDLLIPQVYRYEIDRYKTTLDDVLTYHPGILSSKTTLSSGIIIKAGERYNDYSYVKEAIAYNRKQKINGEVFFFYEGLDEKNGHLGDSLAHHEYKTKACVPYRKENYRPMQFEVIENNGQEQDTITFNLKKVGVYDVYIQTSEKLKPLILSNSDEQENSISIQFIEDSDKSIHLGWQHTNRILANKSGVELSLDLKFAEDKMNHSSDSTVNILLMYNHLETNKKNDL
jgi:uncharacterized lipoprotein YddW (UPF0748 family)